MPVLRAAILCGGAGTRLWPLSRDQAPKQFHPLVGSRSLLTETVARALEIPGAGEPIIVTAEPFADMARDHARDGGAKAPAILLEPSPRNTAPAAAVAAHAALSDDPDAIVILLPSDHHIEDGEAFRRTVAQAVSLANKGLITTLGIVPEDANTGYGYIHRGEALDVGFVVDRFVEKPDAAKAAELFASGEYYWNAGIFVFRADVFLSELWAHRPDIADASERAWQTRIAAPVGQVMGREAWEACPSESIDYAVAEVTKFAAVVPAQIGWSDVGSWSSLMEMAKTDGSGNALFGSVWTQDSKGCYVRSTSRHIAVIGAEDIIVVETPDAILIVHKDATQKVKQAAQSFRDASPKATAAE